MWYDVNRTLSHNCLFNFVVGPRGVGKTYSCKRRVIKDYLNKGEQWVYLRRYKTELEAGKLEKFFDDISDEFPDVDFKVYDGKFYIDGEVAGYYLCLSKAAQYKSIPYPNVMTIIFDEFIIDQGMIRYLPKEVETFNEMYSTIARLRDVRVLFLSNAITFTNPYFLFYDLSLQKDQKIVKRNDILLELVDSQEYSNAAANTRFGRIIANTDYGKYAINNEFLRDSDTFIKKMDSPGVSLFTLVVDTHEFSVYSCMSDQIWYISDKVDPTNNRVISVDVSSHTDGTTLSGDINAKIWLEQLKQKFFRAEVRFTTLSAKNLVIPILKGR